MSLPVAGTKCADCGVCDAAVFADDVPICWHCDAGEPCPGVAERPAKKVHEVEKPEEKKAMARGARGNAIPAETKAAILAADTSVSNSELARRFDISDVTVSKVRREAGIRSTAKRRRALPPVVDGAIKPPKLKPERTAAPEAKGNGSITVTICSAVSEERAREIFARLSSAQKAIALAAVLTHGLERE